MNRLSRLVTGFLSLLVLGTPIALASGAMLRDMTTLAHYYPDTSPVFVVMRADDAHFKSLDVILAKVEAHMPGLLPPDISFADLFTMLTTQDRLGGEEPLGSGDFETMIRPWLGDGMAAGIPSLEGLMAEDNDMPKLFAFEITDREAAERFAIEGIGGGIEIVKENTYTFIDDTSSATDFLIWDDVMLIGNQDSFPYEGKLNASLKQNKDLNLEIALLPEDDYHAVAYLDLPTLMKGLEAMGIMAELKPFQEAVGPMAMGFTLLDNGSLALDFSAKNDLSFLTEMGVTFSQPMAVDSFFAKHIPANAAFVMQATDLTGTLRQALQGLLASQLQTENQNFDQMLGFMDGLAGILGFEAGQDMLVGKTEDYALFASLNPAVLETGSYDEVLPVDVGFLLETRYGRAPSLVTGLCERLVSLSEQFELEDFSLSEERIANMDVLVLRLQTRATPFPIEVLLSANNNVIVLGTRNAVTSVLVGTDNLYDTAAYSAARECMMTGANTHMFINTQVLLPLVEFADAPDNDQVKHMLAMVSSSSGSSLMVDGGYGYSILRLVLTLE